MVNHLGKAVVVILLLASRGDTSSEETDFWETEDSSTEPHVFSTHRLPADGRFMASVGNGHLATNVFSDTVFMNGLYNGKKGRSHRARIPAYANVRLISALSRIRHGSFSLDTRDGVFKVLVNSSRSMVEQRIYAHRFYTRAIVNQIRVQQKPSADPIRHLKDPKNSEILIPISHDPGEESKDIHFDAAEQEVIQGRHVWSSRGVTCTPEDSHYQAGPSEVYLYWTSVPEHLVVPHHGVNTYTFVMVADMKKSVARKELVKMNFRMFQLKVDNELKTRCPFGQRMVTDELPSRRLVEIELINLSQTEQSVLQEDDEMLYDKHVGQWHKMYEASGMELEGDLQLAKMVNGVWYYFLSSLPSDETYQPRGQYYGLSPTGLARGGTFVDYEGHNFWDTEIWMFPSILLLHPHLARDLLQYRLNTAHVAENYAKSTGYKGYRFPWESAFTGIEVTQPCCPEVAEFEQHITGCIAFAARQYIAVTRDEDWLREGGCDLVTRIADFWASRAVLNFGTGLFDIHNVMGPDEDHSNVTNSAFTNVVAGYSLYLAQYASCICHEYYPSHKRDGWAGIAGSLALPYDHRLDYHPEFEDYRRGERIKQADVVLLGYPLQYRMKRKTRRNDLNYYELMTKSSGPAMTWSMHTIGHIQLNDYTRAEQLFKRTYEGYVREPFKVWTELKRPSVGAVNFLTGMGGFLQTLLFGYAGISIQLGKLVIKAPKLPPNTNRFKIKGIQYLGTNLNLIITENGTSLEVATVNHKYPLTFDDGYYNTPLRSGSTLMFTNNGPVTIKSALWKNCKLPGDKIGQNFHFHSSHD